MSKNTAFALWHENSEHSRIRQEPFDPFHGAEILQAKHSLISIGTERLVASGRIPPALHLDMTVPYMGGDLSLPVKYGYSLVGHIPNHPETLFHVMHPHQTLCAIGHTECFEIPPGIPSKRATLASNLETALNAIWDAQLLPGERVLVVGFGMIGSLITRLASEVMGVEVVVTDTDNSRLEIAHGMGFEILDPAQSAIFPFDLAFHTSATAQGLQQSLDMVGREGRVVELSWFGNRTISLELGGEFHSLRKRIVSSQVSSIPPHMQARWNFERRKKKVFDLLANPEFDKHITHTVSLEEAADLFNQWRHEPPKGLGYCIQY